MIALLLLTLAVARAEPPAVSLDQALAAADHHQSVAAADAARDAANANVGVARPARLPSFALSANALYYDDAQTFSLAGSDTPLDCSAFPESFASMCASFAEPTVVREQLTTSVTARATLPLTGQIAAGAQIAAARDSAAAADAGYDAALADARYSALDAWYSALEAEQQLEIARSQITSLRSRVETASASVAAGAMVKSDLLLAQIALAQAEQGALQLTALRDGAYRRLGLAIGNGGAPVRPDGVDPRPLREAPDADALVEAARARRPELIAAEDRAKAARMSARATSLTRLPTVNAIGAYQHQTGMGVFSEPDVGYVGATLDWPVFTWGKALNAARAADATAEATALQRALMEESVGVEVRGRVDALNTAIAGLNVGESIVEQAQENLHIQEARQRAGGATMQEVLDAELTLMRARSTRANAEFTARRAAAALERAVGGDPWAL